MRLRFDVQFKAFRRGIPESCIISKNEPISISIFIHPPSTCAKGANISDKRPYQQ